MSISNEQVIAHPFLKALYRDDYYPDAVVDRGRGILLRLCERIEAERPAGLAELYSPTPPPMSSTPSRTSSGPPAVRSRPWPARR